MAIDITDYSAEDLANASAADLDQLIAQFNIDPNKYRKYFATFDPNKIDSIRENFENQMDSLNLSSKQTFLKAAGDQSSAMRQYQMQSGFEGGGEALNLLEQQKQDIFTKTKGAQRLKATGINIAEEQAMTGEYEDYQEKFMQRLSDVEGMVGEAEAGQRWYNPDDLEHGRKASVTNWFGGKDYKNSPCVVSTALNASGAWSDSEKLDAVNWCKDTHHDGTDRGRTWVNGYHTWGKFLSKWVKRSKVVRWVVDTTTTAFVDHTRRNKKNYLGWMIHNLWINPLSYIIGYSKKNKILGKIATFGMIGVYTILFPLFAIVSIPHVIKEKYGS